MNYLGGKSRLVSKLLPMMLLEAKLKNRTTWVEPFVGGGNMIEKVPATFTRIGIDINPHTIAALTAIRDFPDKLPFKVSELEYQTLRNTPASPINSWIRFAASFASKFDGGYGRSFFNTKNDTTGDFTTEMRSKIIEGRNSAILQSPLLNGVELYTGTYRDFSYFENCLIYCDPPYQGTTTYKTVHFSHYLFWEWVRNMSKHNSVFVSEYAAPKDFTAIATFEQNVGIHSRRKQCTKAVEKLFVYTP